MDKRTLSFLRRPGLGLALIFLGVTAVVVGEFRTLPLCALSNYDEGFILVSAQRLQAGQLPWRDYDPVYGPLEPSVHALLGPNLLRMRLLRASALGALAALSVLCVRRMGAAPLAPLGAAAVVATLSNLVHPVVALLALVGPLVARGLRSDRAQGWFVGAGFVAGLAALARLEFGGLAGLAAAGTVLAHGWQRRLELGRIAKRLLGLVVGVTPSVGVYAALLAAAPERYLASVRATSALGPYAELPYPLPPAPDVELWWLELCRALLPPIAVALGGAVVGWRLLASRRARTAGPDPHGIFLALVLPGLFSYALFRADSVHLFPAFVFGLTLLLGLTAPWLRGCSLKRRQVLHRVGVAALALALGVRLDATIRARGENELVSLKTPVLAGILGDPQRDRFYEGVKASVDELDPSGGPLFVGLGRTLTGGGVVPDHTQINHSDALIYAILERPVAIRQHCLVRGWTTTALKQRELVAELEQTRPQVVLLALDLFHPEPNAIAVREASLLDDYLLAHYTTRWGVGRYAFLSRASSPR